MPVMRPNSSDPGIYSLIQALINRVLGNPTLVASGTGVAWSAVDYAIEERVYSLAASNVAFSGLTNTSATQTRKVRVEVNAAGTLSFKEGPAATALALASLPRRTASLCTLGWFDVPVSFTYGTTAASSLTFYNGDPDLGDGSGLPPNDRGIDATILTAP